MCYEEKAMKSSYVAIEKEKLITMAQDCIKRIENTREERTQEILKNTLKKWNSSIIVKWNLRKPYTLEEVKTYYEDSRNLTLPESMNWGLRKWYGEKSEKIAKKLLNAAKLSDRRFIYVSSDNLYAIRWN